MKRILVYNNDSGVMEFMQPLFEGEGYKVVLVDTVVKLQQYVAEKVGQLLLMDVELLRKEGQIASLYTGIEVIRQIRQKSAMPIIVLSANACEKVKIEALNAGADDYVTCPFSPFELLARVQSQLRRFTQLTNFVEDVDDIYKVDELIIDDGCRKVLVEGREVKLTPLEYKILKLLVREKGRVLSIEQIYESIWNMEAIGADNTIAVHIRHIREKIEKNPKEPKYVKVVWGSGYKVG